MKILILLLIFASCANEHSCEDCFERQDTVIVPPPVIVNDYVYYYDFLVDRNWELSHIEPEIKTKLNSDYVGFEIINQTSDSTHRYKGSYEVGDYFDLALLNKGDTMLFRCRLVWLSGNSTYLNYDTLIK